MGRSSQEKVLAAAYAVSNKGRKPFTRNELIVETWHRFPEDFGLEGFTGDHPNPTKVLDAFRGKGGLMTDNLLNVCSNGTDKLQLTDEGKERATALSKANSGKPLAKQDEKLLRNLLASEAYAVMAKRGGKAALTFTEAAAFFTTNPRHEGKAREAVAQCLNRVEAVLDELTDKAFLIDDQEITIDTVRGLRNIGDVAYEKFKRRFDQLAAKDASDESA